VPGTVTARLAQKPGGSWLTPPANLLDQPTNEPDHVASLHCPAPDSMMTARAGMALKRVPDGERGPDCWGVDISADLEVLKAIPGWYLECWACCASLYTRALHLRRLPSSRDDEVRSADANDGQ
jgi:hypothetical protein